MTDVFLLMIGDGSDGDESRVEAAYSTYEKAVAGADGYGGLSGPLSGRIWIQEFTVDPEPTKEPS